MLTKEEVQLAQLNGVLDDIYAQEVERLIRQKYKRPSDEIAIIRKKEAGLDKDNEFQIYNDYVEQCKIQAKKNIQEVINNG